MHLSWTPFLVTEHGRNATSPGKGGAKVPEGSCPPPDTAGFFGLIDAAAARRPAFIPPL